MNGASRAPAGIPSGGQFATHGRSASTVSLDGERSPQPSAVGGPSADQRMSSQTVQVVELRLASVRLARSYNADYARGVSVSRNRASTAEHAHSAADRAAAQMWQDALADDLGDFALRVQAAKPVDAYTNIEIPKAGSSKNDQHAQSQRDQLERYVLGLKRLGIDAHVTEGEPSGHWFADGERPSISDEHAVMRAEQKTVEARSSLVRQQSRDAQLRGVRAQRRR